LLDLSGDELELAELARSVEDFDAVAAGGVLGVAGTFEELSLQMLHCRPRHVPDPCPPPRQRIDRDVGVPF
jgi:hypothetical protein